MTLPVLELSTDESGHVCALLDGSHLPVDMTPDDVEIEWKREGRYGFGTTTVWLWLRAETVTAKGGYADITSRGAEYRVLLNTDEPMDIDTTRHLIRLPILVGSVVADEVGTVRLGG